MKTPPLIIGAAVIFWGIEMRQPVLAALMAAAVEASRWIKHRWDLNETDFKIVTALSTLALFGLALYQFLTGWFNHAAWMIFKWLPVVLLPVFLAQLYSTAGRINPHTLFLFRKKRIPADQNRWSPFDLSYLYLVICVFSAGFVNQRSGVFYVGMLVLAGWALWSHRPRQSSLVVWMLLMFIAGGAGFMGQIGLAKLQTIVEKKTTHLFTPRGDSYRKFTQIGDIPDEKLSDRIVFRARTGGMDERSLLLREATYDTFRSLPSIWSFSRKPFQFVAGGGDQTTWLLAPASPDARTCMIAQYLKGYDALLKLPCGAFQVDGLNVDRAEKNGFGAVKIRGDGLISYTTLYGRGSPLISPPGKIDLAIPKREAGLIADIAEQLNLKSLPPPEILRKIKLFFATEFTYSLKPGPKKRNSTPVVNFLTHTRSGHCEYFATATALLLRQCGIPARYARGYAVNPADTMGGWSLVRTRYAHAWAVAYVGNTWVNLDTTPGSWQTTERKMQPHWQQYWQKIKDILSAAMFQFTQWRQKMKHQGHFKYIALLLLPFFLWAVCRIVIRFSRRRRLKKAVDLSADRTVETIGSDSAFYRIEQRLTDLGLRRHPWETFSAWLDRIETTFGRDVSLEIPRKMLGLHYRYRFDPRGLSAAEKLQLTEESSIWLAQKERQPLPLKSSRQSGLERTH